MKRSRSGCQTCRGRRIKCDEGRPICNNCHKRGLRCTYEMRYQWIVQDDFGKEKESRAQDQVIDKAQQVISSGHANGEQPPRNTKKSRQGPTSRKRKIGQSVVNTGCFHPSRIQNLKTVMTEMEFSAEDEPVTVLNGPGSLTQFKKFRIEPRHRPNAGPNRNITKGLASPLLRPVLTNTLANALSDSPLSPAAEPPRAQHEHSRYATSTTTTAAATRKGERPDALWALPQAAGLEHGSNGSENGSSHPASMRTPVVSTSTHHISNQALRALQSHRNTLSMINVKSRPMSASPAEIFAESQKLLLSHKSKHQTKLSLSGLSEKDFFDHFIDVTADALVPIPYEENPFLSLLPKLALSDKNIWDLLVAYGASHRSMLLHGLDSDPIDDAIVDQLINRCSVSLDELRSLHNEDEKALLMATVLSMIEVDRGNPSAWFHYMDVALDLINSRLTFTDWDLEVETNSMSFRLVGYMIGIGSIFSPTDNVLEFPSWPQWTGSLDYLTGIDLNLLPLFSEAAELVSLIKKSEHTWTLRERAQVNYRALRILQRMNDYWLDEFWPDSEITAMCIMFQEALQIHVLRRVLKYPTEHKTVQRLVYLAMSHLERYVPPASTIQRCMTFILVTIASESLVPEQRTSLLIRLRHMGEAGFAYNWKMCDHIRKHWEANTSLIINPMDTLI